MTTNPDGAVLELVERLKARHAELSARLRRVSADRSRRGRPLDPDFAEQAVERENDEVLDALDQVERGELEAIAAALRRIDAGCFGICDDCGDVIDPLRLEAQPAAECCLRCAEAREWKSPV